MKTDKTLKQSRLALAAMVQAYMLMINAALDRLDGRKTFRLCQKLSTVIRNHLKIRHKLYRYVLSERLSDTRSMRLQVQRDLGGKAAMVKWEVRRRGQKVVPAHHAANKDLVTPNFARGSDGERSRVKPGMTIDRKPWTPKTDRFGNFRLASISTGPMPKRTVKTRRVSMPRDMRFKFHAIEVTATDLLANRLDSTEYWLPPARSEAAAGHNPPIERVPI